MAALTIPRVLHRIWLDEPVPEEFDAHWARFRELHPGWELVTWDDSSKLGWMRCRAEYDAASSHAGRADVLRYEIMAEHGGVYVDTDVEPLRAFDELLVDPRPFAGWEDDNLLCPTVIGSPAGHPAATELLEALPRWVRKHQGRPPNEQTGPLFFTSQWRQRADVRRLPPSAFYPVGWWERELLGKVEYPPESYSVHHWVKGWADRGGNRKRPELPKRRPVVAPRVAKPEPAPSVSPGDVSILVPFRAEQLDDTRTVVWDWVRRRWEATFPEAEIVVGTDAGMPFSKSAAVNDAYLRATRDVLVLADADTWMDRELLLQAGGAAVATGRLVLPWRKLVRLKKSDSDLMLRGRPDADFDLSREVRQRAFSSPSTRTAAALLVITREAFERVEGMDPRFRGWGYEDVCFGLCCDRVLGNTRHLLVGDAVCMFHPRPVAGGGRVWEGETDSGVVGRALNLIYRDVRNRDEMLELCSQHPLRGELQPAARVARGRPGARITI